MSKIRKSIEVDLEAIKKLVESEWDDNMLRLKVGEFVLQQVERQDAALKRLLNIKFVSEPKRARGVTREPGPRCCRGRE
jgi:hypothetical protein